MAQGAGWNQNAHYALVRALSNGTPQIDRTQYETGTWYRTGDYMTFEGHYYAAKAPGLAFASLPAYLPLKAAGIWDSGDATRMLWFLTLWTVVLPAGILLVLVRGAAERLQPGTGTVAAVTLGVATLILPFSTLYFAHLLSATLGFAAFAVLWRERDGLPRLGPVALAGLLAGLATTTEYPLGIIALILGLYAVSRAHFVARGLAYAAGGVVGALPLLLYQWWAFGSPAHFSYTNVYGGLNATGTFGVTAPSFRQAMDLLFSSLGLLRLSPVLALAIPGVVLMYRRGRRAEALVVGAISISFVAYNAGYETPFGGNSPGPRFLIAILPFLALALAPVFVARPLTTLALAVPSAVIMVVVTVTHPIENWAGHAQWFQRLGDGNYSATVLSFFRPLSLDDLSLPSSTTWYPLLLFLVPLVLAVAFAAADRLRVRLSRQDAITGGACLVGWLVIQRQGPKLLEDDRSLVVLALVAAVIVLALALPHVYRTERFALSKGESSGA